MSEIIDTLSQEEYNYIASVIEDDNYEFPISDDEEYSLFTDWEGEGTFFPSVTILHNVNEDEAQAEIDRIERLLEEYDWFVYNRITDIQEEDGMAHAYFQDPEIDSDVKSAVENSL